MCQCGTDGLFDSTKIAKSFVTTLFEIMYYFDIIFGSLIISYGKQIIDELRGISVSVSPHPTSHVATRIE